MSLSFEAIDLDMPGEGWRRNCGADDHDALYAVEAWGRQHRDSSEEPMLSLKWMPTGSAVYRYPRRTHRLEGDSLLLSPPGEPFDVELSGKGLSRSFCLFVPHPAAAEMWAAATASDATLLDVPSTMCAPAFPHVSTSGWRDLTHDLALIRASLCNEQSADEEVGILLLECLLRVRRLSRAANRLPATRLATREELLRRLLRARDLVEADPTARPSLSTLAKEASLSRYHLLRCFVKAFGETPGNYAARKRIDVAADLLSRTRKSIVEVAAEVGFESQSAFTRSFQRWRGISPLAYRKGVRD